MSVGRLRLPRDRASAAVTSPCRPRPSLVHCDRGFGERPSKLHMRWPVPPARSPIFRLSFQSARARGSSSRSRSRSHTEGSGASARASRQRCVVAAMRGNGDSARSSRMFASAFDGRVDVSSCALGHRGRMPPPRRRRSSLKTQKESAGASSASWRDEDEAPGLLARGKAKEPKDGTIWLVKLHRPEQLRSGARDARARCKSLSVAMMTASTDDLGRKSSRPHRRHRSSPPQSRQLLRS